MIHILAGVIVFFLTTLSGIIWRLYTSEFHKILIKIASFPTKYGEKTDKFVEKFLYDKLRYLEAVLRNEIPSIPVEESFKIYLTLFEITGKVEYCGIDYRVPSLIIRDREDYLFALDRLVKKSGSGSDSKNHARILVVSEDDLRIDLKTNPKLFKKFVEKHKKLRSCSILSHRSQSIYYRGPCKKNFRHS